MIRPFVRLTALACILGIGSPIVAANQGAETTSSSAPSPSERIQKLVDASRKGAAGLDVIHASLSDPEPEVRAAAVQMAWEVGGADALEHVLPLADDPDERVSQAALLGMVGGTDPRAIERVRRAMNEAPDSVRAQLAAAIGDRKRPEYVDALGGLLGSDQAALRRTAVEAMRAIQSQDTFPYLMSATADGDAGVVARAVGALGALGNPKAAARLVALAKSDNARVRAAVGEAIPAIDATGDHVEILIGYIEDPDRSVTIAVLNGLQRHYSDAGLAVLDKASRSGDPRIRRSAVRALGSAPGTAGSEILSRMVEDADEAVRASAVQTIAERDLVALMSRVTARVSDDSVMVRTAVAGALGWFGTPEAFPALRALARDTDPGVRAAVAEALGFVIADGSHDVLVTLSKDAQPFVRSAAIRALAERGDGPSREAVRRAIKDADTGVRIVAITEVGRLKDREALDAIREALSDPAEPVRAAARTAMSELRDPS